MQAFCSQGKQLWLKQDTLKRVIVYSPGDYHLETNYRKKTVEHHHLMSRTMSTHLLGMPSPSFSSPRSLQSWSSSMLESLGPSPVAYPVVASPRAPVPMISMDVDSITAFLMNGNTAAPPPPPPPKANGSNQVTPTEPITPASSLQEDIEAGHGEVQARGGDGTPVTKKPINRLMNAVSVPHAEITHSS